MECPPEPTGRARGTAAARARQAAYARVRRLVQVQVIGRCAAARERAGGVDIQAAATQCGGYGGTRTLAALGGCGARVVARARPQHPFARSLAAGPPLHCPRPVAPCALRPGRGNVRCALVESGMRAGGLAARTSTLLGDGAAMECDGTNDGAFVSIV
jgi:hypothetical protein